MKRLVQLSLVVLLLSSAVFAQSENIKIGYINSDIILKQLPEAIKAEGDLKAMEAKFKAELDEAATRLQNEYVEYQRKAQTTQMSQTQRDSIAQYFMYQQQMLEQRRNEMSEELMDKREELLAPIQAKVVENVEIVSKEEKMQYVFDRVNSSMIYADAAYDITYKVLDRIKRGQK
ncbi:MAG: OmpH family outer membrane protein [Ignavibacteriaceae bacterium]|nr:OmpH family outer membrane protein [Ignavibacteriaceae bacterium]